MGWDHDIDTSAHVVCLCGGEHCHPLRVTVNQGGDCVDVGPRGVETTSRGPSGRGTAIAIEFACEDCPRTFLVAYQFHKGATYTGRCRGRPRESQIGEPIAAMWRD
jgi:hypothetical protein